MRSVITGMGCLFICIVVFITCATIQINANIAVELSNAANEAAYQTVLTLTERDEITTDEQLEQEFVQDAGFMLHGSDAETAYKDSKNFEHSKE